MWGANRFTFPKNNKVIVPNKYKNFILCEFEDGLNQILVFCSPDNKAIITKVNHYSVNGTFEFIISPLLQLFTIHGDLGSNSVSTNIISLIFGTSWPFGHM